MSCEEGSIKIRVIFLLIAYCLSTYFSLSNAIAAPLNHEKKESASISIIESTDGKTKDFIAGFICTLHLAVDGPSAQFTIKNNSKNVTALNIRSYFGSALQDKVSETGNTCNTLEPGSTCTLTFTPGSSIVPATNFIIKGTNTTAIMATIQISDKPSISITNPIQSARVVEVAGGTTNIEITNSPASALNATGVTVTSKAGCPAIAVDASNCTSIAPGTNCSLGLTTAIPYIPCTITISGTNTANSPTTQIAFSLMNGLVFEVTGGIHGTVLGDLTTAFASRWTLSATNVAGATDSNDGVTNSFAIRSELVCIGTPTVCAALRCQNSLGAGWYLPAVNQLATAYSLFCSNGAIPCNFGGFVPGNHWSSTQADLDFAGTINFPNGTQPTLSKISTAPVRCALDF